jgi:hypothetical protein
MRHYSWNDGPENEPKLTDEERQELEELEADNRNKAEKYDKYMDTLAKALRPFEHE